MTSQKEDRLIHKIKTLTTLVPLITARGRQLRKEQKRTNTALYVRFFKDIAK